MVPVSLKMEDDAVYSLGDALILQSFPAVCNMAFQSNKLARENAQFETWQQALTSQWLL